MKKLLLVSAVAILAACGKTDIETEVAPSDTVTDNAADNTITTESTDTSLRIETFPVINTSGNNIGTVTISDLPSAGVKLDLNVTTIPAGSHALHLHQIGSCETPDFKSAGGHYNPSGHNHGFDAEAPNPHAGDMPNFNAPQSGEVQTEILNERVTLSNRDGYAPLFDADGSALIIHAGADDYVTQPTGAAGARIACAVITP